MKEQQIKIPAKLFLSVYSLIEHIGEHPGGMEGESAEYVQAYNEKFTKLYKEIKKGIDDKIEAHQRRDLYTKSKMASTPDEREAARKGYVEASGMPPSYWY